MPPCENCPPITPVAVAAQPVQVTVGVLVLKFAPGKIGTLLAAAFSWTAAAPAEAGMFTPMDTFTCWAVKFAFKLAEVSVPCAPLLSVGLVPPAKV